MAKLTASQEIIGHILPIIKSTDVDNISKDLKLIHTAIKALAIEEALLQDEDYVKLEDVWERLKKIKESMGWDLNPIVCYSTGEPVPPYVIDLFLQRHGKEQSFLDMYGENKVQKVVLIGDKLMLYLSASSNDELDIND